MTLNEYNKYLNIVNNYNNIFTFELNPNKVNEIKTLFTDYLFKRNYKYKRRFWQNFDKINEKINEDFKDGNYDE